MADDNEHGTPGSRGENLSAEIRNLLAISASEDRQLNESQQRARFLIATGQTVPEAAKELAGNPGCSRSTLKKLSARFGWANLRKQIDAQRAKTADEVVAERMAKDTLDQAEQIKFGKIPETPEQIQARHFHVATKVLEAIERSLPKYGDGLAEETERTTKKLGGLKETKAKKKTSAGNEVRTKRKGYTALTVAHLKQLSDVAKMAMAERRKAAGIEDDDAPRDNPADAATLALYNDLSGLDDDALGGLIERELADGPD